MACMPDAPTRGPWAALELASDELAVTVLPGKGCDIVELIDRASGIDVMMRTPWGYGRPPTTGTTSAERWIEAYSGGWQVLLPNGGDAADEHGVEWGFHGEAGVIAWTLDTHEATAATLSTALVTAPLTLERELRVHGRTFELVERVRNEAEDPIDVMWGHHPAFGAPLIAPGATIAPRCRTFVADTRAPGAGLEPGARAAWPHAPLAAGGTVDLSVIPPLDEPRSVLGYLTDFETGEYTIANAAIGLSATVRWPIELFPHAWFWQELHGLPGFPWYRRTYTQAVEPGTTYPAHGIVKARAAGGVPLTLAAGETRTARLELSLGDA
jgi:hypothetical protein